MITLPQEHEDTVQYCEEIIKEIETTLKTIYKNTFPDDIEFEEPLIDEIVTGLKKRLDGSYLWESSKIKKLWRDGLIDKEECEKRLGELGLPDSKSLWAMRWMMRKYKLLKDPKTGKEKTRLNIKPSNKKNSIR
jgi:hypothetical protein